MRLIVRLLAVAVVLGAAYLFAPGFATGPSLARSLSRAVNHGGEAHCHHKRGRVWSCSAWDAALSGGADYRLVVDGRCWRARLTGPLATRADTPPRAHGCVRPADNGRVVDRVSGLLGV